MRDELLTTPDAPIWQASTEARLREFPLMLHHDQRLASQFLHFQPGIEIHITHQGRALFKADGCSLLQKHRHAVLIRGDVAHSQHIDPRWEYVRTVICIDDSRLRTLNHFGNALLESFHQFPWSGSKPLTHIVLSTRTYYRVRALCSDIDAEFRGGERGWQSSVLGLMLQLLVELERSVGATSEGDDTSANAPKLKPELGLVQACGQYVSAHLAEDLSPPSVAAAFYVSREHLTRIFRKEIGLSFTQYVMVERVEEAKRLLLASPEMTVTEVAEAVGFRTVQHFCRVFRNLVGETPSEYRQKGNAQIF